MKFRRLTPQQRETLDVVRRLGSMTVTPRDARQLRALKRRGLVRYTRDAHGVRVVIYRGTAATRRKATREKRWISPTWEAMHKGVRP